MAGQEVEDMGVAMSQFWAGRLTMRGLVCRSFGAGLRIRGALLWQFWGWEVEDMEVVMLQFWCERLMIWGLLRRSFGAGG